MTLNDDDRAPLDARAMTDEPGPSLRDDVEAISGEPALEGVPLRLLPKVSLHDHLDGGLLPETVIELAAVRGVTLPVEEPRALAEWFEAQSDSGSLVDYLKTFEITVALMQHAEDLERVARDYVHTAARDGIVYAEVRWAPEQHVRAGLSLDEAVAAVQRGLAAGMAEVAATGDPIVVRQLLCAMRMADRGDEIAELALRHRGAGVVGFDIAGPEDGYPPARLRSTFDRLQREWLPVTVHAGEAAGLESIRSALLDGHALRLGHGVRIAEDIAEARGAAGSASLPNLGPLASWVRDRQIALEVSPTSNLQSGAVAAWGPSMRDHPFDLLYRLGFAVTVNTDNRLMSRTSLTTELDRLAQAFDYTLDDLEVFQLTAAEAAFVDADERSHLVDRIITGFERARGGGS